MLPSIGEFIIIGLIFLIVFGSNGLPKLGHTVGSTLRGLLGQESPSDESGEDIDITPKEPASPKQNKC